MTQSHFNPAILETAGRHLGVEEWPGARHNPIIQGFFAASGANQNEADETPWCAAFVGAVLAEMGLPNTGRLNARSYLDWGVPVAMADVMPGDVVVFWRGQPSGWQGHVGFVVRFDGDRVICRGGNQGNKVSDGAYPVSRVLGYRRAVAADQAGRPVLRHEARGALVEVLQRRLSELGYFAGRVDGHFGDRTRAAVQAFQADHDLALDGVVGRETWAALDGAQPRPTREVSAEDLRESGSRTIGAADRGQTLTGLSTVGAGLTVVTGQVEDAAQAIEGARGALETAQELIMAFWPLLLVLGSGLLLWHFFGQVKAARVEDARTGRNMGR